jgi:tRNA(Arg) A34 adenosine deaminase TadA
MCREEAERGIRAGDVPIACVITDLDGVVVVTARNTQNSSHDPTAHAEINALRALGTLKRSRHLPGHALFSNAETCSMCASAAIKARIADFYYGAPAEPSMDPWLPLREVAARSRLTVRIQGPIQERECAEQIARGRAGVSETPQPDAGSGQPRVRPLG